MEFKFATQKSEEQQLMVGVEKLVEIQAMHLRETYHTDCLDAKQLQKVLNIGESNAYEWLKDCSGVRVIGRRKVVPIVWVAYYLVTGKKV